MRNSDEFLEKLRYIHRNPVKRGLCASPEQWPWSSFRHYWAARLWEWRSSRSGRPVPDSVRQNESHTPQSWNCANSGPPAYYYKLPIDAADSACWTHDVCYASCRENYKCDRKGRKSCMVKCNHDLAKQARLSGVNNCRVKVMIWIMEDHMPEGTLNDLVGSDESCGCNSSK